MKSHEKTAAQVMADIAEHIRQIKRRSDGDFFLKLLILFNSNDLAFWSGFPDITHNRLQQVQIGGIW